MRKLALLVSILFPASLLFPAQALAEDPQGPRLIYGAPVRHTLTSCSTNPGQAVACIQSVTLTPKSGDAPISGVITDLKIPGDPRIADSERPISAPDAATLAAGSSLPEPKVTRGFYNEWTFPEGKENNSANNVFIVAELQPYKATWCWTADICNDRREEFSLAISPSKDNDLLKNNPNYSFSVTIRAPKSFEFGEVSGSAKDVIVKYGKDLQTVGGVATREIIATLSPIATARGGTPTQVAEKATVISYGANIWIYGQNNGIVDNLGPCGKIGGVQVVSNAMHSLDPTWDTAEDAIAVRLSTPHLLPDGSLNVGYLEIRMPREAALCMWKVDLDGSVKASVSISYDDGSAPSIATVSGKRVGDDYLIVSAGFHYSSPTLRVKLGQNKATETQTTATETQTTSTEVQKIAAAKKITIKCKKGSLTKKVTAVKPACPSGYKKV
jgi:anti-sigma28 factor (negative regulator of flagellin synthesis)